MKAGLKGIDPGLTVLAALASSLVQLLRKVL